MSTSAHRLLVLATASAALSATTVIPTGAASAQGASAAAPRTYANCTALNQAHPHGVGRPGARDRTSGTPVTTFTRNKALYLANSGSDRDKGGVACEKA